MTKYIFLVFLCFSIPALAQNETPLAESKNSTEPIEITANQTLEWHRNALKFIAKGNALARQGAISIAGQTLTADYKSTEKSNIDIWRLTAEQEVIIKNEDSTAYGDKGVYDVSAGTATLTGQDLKLITPEQTITAADSFIYTLSENRATAIGKAKVIRPLDTLEANRIEAVFNENKGQDKNAIKTLEARENVIITTQTERLTGDYAIYHAATNKAEVKGNVKITRGPNVLEGARAEIDLTTNISKIFGTESTGERVRGIFYPRSTEQPSSEKEDRPLDLKADGSSQ